MLALMKDNNYLSCVILWRYVREIGTDWKGQRERGKKQPSWQRSSGTAGRAGAYHCSVWHFGSGRGARDEDVH